MKYVVLGLLASVLTTAWAVPPEADTCTDVGKLDVWQPLRPFQVLSFELGPNRFFQIGAQNGAVAWSIGDASPKRQPLLNTLTVIQTRNTMERLCVWQDQTSSEHTQVFVSEITADDLETKQALLMHLQAAELVQVAQYRAAAMALEAAGKKKLASDAWLAAGMLHQRAFNFASAKLDLERARFLGDEHWAVYYEGISEIQAGNIQAAIELFHSIVNAIPDSSDGEVPPDYALVLAARNYLGLAYFTLGNYERARHWLNKALETEQHAPDLLQKTKILNNIASLSLREGRGSDAHEVFVSNAETYMTLGEKIQASQSWSNAAQVSTFHGDYVVALSELMRADNLARETPFQSLVVQRRYAEVYRRLGMLEEARSYLRSAHRPLPTIENPLAKAGLSLALGRLQLAQGNLTDARQSFLAGLEGVSSAGNSQTGGLEQSYSAQWLRCELARLELEDGNLIAATGWITTLQDSVPKPAYDVSLCVEEVEADVVSVEFPNKAVLRFADLASQYDGYFDPVGVQRVLFKRAQIALRVGEIDAALSQFQLLLDKLLDRSAGFEYDLSYLESQRRVIDQVVTILMQRGMHEEALRQSVKWRGRIARAALTGEGSGTATELRRAIATLRFERDRAAASGDLEHLERSLLKIRSLEEQLPPRQTIENHGFAFDERLPEEQLLYFHVTQRELFFWLVGPKRTVARRVEDVPGLASLADRFYFDIRNGADLAIIRENGSRLFTKLFGAGQDLQKLTQLTIVPDRFLHRVPFEALPLPSLGAKGPQYLIDQLDISYMSSVGFGESKKPRNLESRGVPSNNGLTFVGAERDNHYVLAGSELEERAIRNVFERGMIVKRTNFKEPQETRSVFEHPNPILHISAHGYANVIDGRTSAIMLEAGPAEAFQTGELVTAAELAGFSLTQDLVVLSACETGAGPISPTLGAIGLQSALLFGGVAEVISTRWKVTDRTAVRFSEEYYPNRFTSASNSSRALGDALRAIKLKQPHPRHWAGFTSTISLRD